ncbi:hypothetical protein XENTR_v10012332 [Xenopus tropicalis]|nr:hypothetical protein XENTR_v10012332 [Xenopus tropicalis]
MISFSTLNDLIPFSKWAAAAELFPVMWACPSGPQVLPATSLCDTTPTSYHVVVTSQVLSPLLRSSVQLFCFREELRDSSVFFRMATDGDFLLRYRAVSNKLKKRFLRKPNVAEASEQFGQLAKELKQQDCLQYAGFCNLAMARCEQTLFNAPGEAMALTEAARLFLQEEKETQRLKCPGFEEHLQAAINCYSFAIKVYIELNQPVMAASLCLELGNSLKDMSKLGEAIVYFQRAAELQTQVPIECLLSLGYVASCKIMTRDYDGALAVFTEMQLLAQEKGLHTPGNSLPVGAFLDIIAKCEVSRVLLLMLLQVQNNYLF